MNRALCLILSLSLLPGTTWARITPPTTDTDGGCWGGVSYETCTDSTGRFIPTTDNTQSLGTSALRWSSANFGSGIIASGGNIVIVVPTNDYGSVFFTTSSVAAVQAGSANYGSISFDGQNGVLRIGDRLSGSIISIPLSGTFVGIGTTSPGYALDVFGVVRSTGLVNSNISGHSGQIKCVKDNAGTEGYCSVITSTPTATCTCN